MSNATFLALGAAALGVIVFSFCLYVAMSARRKKEEEGAARPAAQRSTPEA